MEDGGQDGGATQRSTGSPPPPPNPNADAAPAPQEVRTGQASDVPLLLTCEEWDITSISGLAALRMLVDALQSLANVTGDVPPTPPVTRPTTPKSPSNSSSSHQDDSDESRGCSSPVQSSSSTSYPTIPIGSPEAHPHEPLPNIGANAEEISLQHAAIARRFFSKVAPPFTLSEYLLRFHKWCPHSPGVYLAAATYIQKLCVSDLLVPATNRTIHRLSLASIRIAAKALEDNKWSQERVAKVGGISRMQLRNLEITLCFLLDFELWVDDKMLAKRMYLLQQAARQGLGVRGRLGSEFRMTLPERMRERLQNRRHSTMT